VREVYTKNRVLQAIKRKERKYWKDKRWLKKIDG
jgi:hypothetical protein